MPTVAEQLRTARESMKLDVSQAADVTKLKTDQIRALEEANYDYFTAVVYLRGSVRTYANLLKLDAPGLLAQLDTELVGTKKFSGESHLPGRKRSLLDHVMLLLSRVNWAVALVVLGLAVISLVASLGYRAWTHHQQSDPLKKLGSGQYQAARPTPDLLPLPTNVVRRSP